MTAHAWVTLPSPSLCRFWIFVKLCGWLLHYNICPCARRNEGYRYIMIFLHQRFIIKHLIRNKRLAWTTAICFWYVRPSTRLACLETSQTNDSTLMTSCSLPMTFTWRDHPLQSPVLESLHNGHYRIEIHSSLRTTTTTIWHGVVISIVELLKLSRGLSRIKWTALVRSLHISSYNL